MKAIVERTPFFSGTSNTDVGSYRLWRRNPAFERTISKRGGRLYAIVDIIY